jgi:hypothetical protein
MDGIRCANYPLGSFFNWNSYISQVVMRAQGVHEPDRVPSSVLCQGPHGLQQTSHNCQFGIDLGLLLPRSYLT